MVAVETFLRESAISLARRLAGRPGLFVLRSDDSQALRPSDVEASFVGCDPVEESEALVPEATVDAHAWCARSSAPRWVGFVPYEIARGLERKRKLVADLRPPPFIERPRWLRYDAVARIDRASGRVVVEADDFTAAKRLVERLRVEAPAVDPFSLGPLEWSESDAVHADRVARVLEYIRAGDVYQVNLARRAAFGFSGSALSFFDALTTAAPSPYGFFLDVGDRVVVGSSPELALEVRGHEMRTAPIKGTRTRGADALEDAALAAELDADPKERAELTMAIDLHRNDLGKTAAVGSVRVLGEPRVVFGKTVMSRIAEVVARAREGTSMETIVRGILPCGSVTGAPKIRAMEIIAELESARRGLYTGMVGTVRRDGGLTLAMAIRTAVLAGERGEYFAGGGIVIDSDPAREAQETRWKTEHLARLVPTLSRTL